MKRPIAPARRATILKRVRSIGSVAVADLAASLGASQETIRRDLKALAAEGRLSVVHGGATAPSVEPPLKSRMEANAAGKAAIGRLAATLVKADDAVFIDSGATGAAIAAALARIPRLTVVTASLPIARVLLETSEARVFLMGGEIDRGDLAVMFPPLEAFDAYRIDVAFLGAGGLGPDGEITDFSIEAARYRNAVMGKAARAYIAVDSSKFGAATPIRLPDSDRLTGLLVDRAPPPSIMRALRRRGIAVLATKKDRNAPR